MFISLLLEDPPLFWAIVFIVLVSIVLHELAHGVIALQQGDDTPRVSGHLTFNPLVHMGAFAIVMLMCCGIAWGAMPVNPDNFKNGKWSKVWVSLAGPLANFLLCLLCANLAALLANLALWLPQIGSFRLELFQQFFFLAGMLNFVLFLFNLLPIPGFDGFHVLAELFPAIKGLQTASVSLVILLLLFNIPKFWDLLYGLGMIVCLSLAAPTNWLLSNFLSPPL